MKIRLLLLAVTWLSFNTVPVFAETLGNPPGPPISKTAEASMLPTATISGTATTCVGAPQPLITFTGANETAPYTFTYTINGGAPQTVTTTSGNSVTVAVPTATAGTFTYDLVSVSCPTAGCIQPQSGSATITVVPPPTAAVTGTATVCVGGPQPVITFTGNNETAPYTFTYNINGGAVQSITTTSGNSVTIPVNTTTAGTFAYNLLSVTTPTAACVQPASGTATVSVVNLPTAAIGGGTNICPGTTATLSFTGTPNSIVVFFSSTGSYYITNLNASGTSTFVTPVLNSTTTFTLYSASSNPPGCTNDTLTGSATVTVNQNGCASVLAGDLDLEGAVAPICVVGECRDLTANYVDLGTTTQYSVSSIPFCPQASFTDNTFTPISVNIDDVWSGDIPLPFNFCFYGTNYTSANVGSNGVISFNSFAAGSYCNWPFTQTIPNAGFPIRNAIYGVYQDINPGVAPPAGTTIQIGYKLTGTYPCRKLIVNFTNVPQFSCNNSVGTQTSQIVLYEISNIIEVYIKRRVPCTTWNSGSGLVGIQNNAGTQAVTPPGRNTGTWSAFDEAWRFTPDGPSAVTFQWLDENGNQISTNTNITVCPAVTSTYTAEVVYNFCGNVTTITSDVVVEVIDDLTQDPDDLSECDAIFDLTENTPIIIGSENPLDYDITYHLTAADAQNSANPIVDPDVFPSAGQTIFASIINFNTPCILVKPFELIVPNCSCPTITVPTGAQTVCLNGNPDPISVTTELTGADAISFVYFNTAQTGDAPYTGGMPLSFSTPNGTGVASYDPPALGAAGSLPSVVGTYYVYGIANPTPTDPNCREWQEIIIVVVDLPTATISVSGSTSICSGDSSTITFNGTPGAVVTYTIDSGANQTITLNASGTASLPTGVLTATTVYDLVDVADSSGTCSQTQSGSATVTVLPLPTATISGTTTICQNGPSPNITFTGAGATAPYTFTYNINGGANTTITTTSGNSVTLAVSTAAVGAFTYTLVSVASSGTPSCSQPQPGSATVTVGPLPTASASGTTTVCQGAASPNVTFTGASGTAPYTFNYTINGGAVNTVTTTSGDSVTVAVPTGALGTFGYEVTQVSANGCVQAQSETATITVAAPPTATISGNTTICPGDTAVITFTGTPGATVTYTEGGGANQTITLNASGTATLTTPALSVTTPYSLVSASDAAGCTQSQSGTATVTMAPLPTAIITGTTTVCQNGTSPSVTFTGAGGTAPYTFTYNINGGANATITTTAGNSITIAAPTGAAGTFDYNLLSVQSSGTPSCSQVQSGTATVTVTGLATAGISGTVSVCQNAASPSITFTGANGAAPYDFTYTINGGAVQTVTATSGNSVTVSAPTNATGVYDYVLTGVTSNGCSQLQGGTATVTVTALPVATIAGSTTICSGDTAVITFGGTPGATITYTIGGGANQTITLNASGSNTLTTAALTATTPYALVSVTDTSGCSQNQSGTATVTVLPLPTATISGTTTVCQNDAAPSVTFTGANGVAPYTFTYNINGGSSTTITTTSGDSVTIAAPTNVAGVFDYELLSVESSSAPVCSQAQSGTATITVRALPTATISGTTTVCQNTPQPQVTFTGAGGTAPYTFAYNVNGGAPQTISTTTGDSVSISVSTAVLGNFDYVLLSVQDSGSPSCAQSQSGMATVSVSPPPTAFASSPNVLCDDNNDGFSCLFDLHSNDAQISGGVAGVSVAYFETPTDAQNNVNEITDPLYCNIVSTNQTIYVRVYFTASPDCASFTTLELEVTPRPVANPVISEYALCDVDNPGDFTQLFNLTTKNTEVLNGQTGTSVNYYLTSADALSGLNPIAGPSAYANVSNPQTIWAGLQNAQGCRGVGSFLIRVNPLPGVTAPGPMTVCSNGPTNFAQFDLTLNDAVISQGAGGVQVSYYATQGQAAAGTNAITGLYTNTSNPQTIYVAVQNTTTLCRDFTTLTLNVAQGPVANTPAPLVKCDPNSDGFTSFDLTDAFQDISGGPVPPDVTITVHETLTDAQNGVEAQASPYLNIAPYNQTLYASVTYNVNGCRTIVELQLVVNDTPVANEPEPLQQCDDNADGFGVFNLSDATPDILTGLVASQHTVVYYLSEPDAQSGTSPIATPGSFANTVADMQTVWASVTHNTTGCFDVVSLDLIVNPLPVPAFPVPSYTLCDVQNPGDEQEEFDLSTRVDMALNGQTGMQVSFHATQAQAQSGANALGPLYTNTSNAQTLFVRVENLQTGCVAYTTMDLRVEPLPVLLPPPGPITLCDPNGDGFEEFDLDALVADMVQGAPDVVVTFHETQTDADLGVSAITDTASYTNISSFIYVRAFNTQTGCSSVIMIELETIASPQAPQLDALTECDQDNNTQDQRTYFDLTQQTPIVVAAQSNPNVIVEYYLSEPAAQQGTAPIIQDTNYFSSGSNPQTIWVRVEDAMGECFDVGSFELIVNGPLALSTPAPLSLCDDGPTTTIPQQVFDLSVKIGEITQNLPGYQVVFYPSYANALAGTNAISSSQQTAYTNVSNPQTLGVQVISPEGCSSYITLDIRVLPLPVPLQDPPVLQECDDNLPAGTQEFDLTQNQAYLANGDTNLTFVYYTSLTDAQAGTNPVPDPTAYEGAGTVWIVVSNSQSGASGTCSVMVEQQLIVNPLPGVAQTPVPYTICDSNNTGVAVFALNPGNTELSDDILDDPQDTADFTITYYATAADAQSGTNPLPANYTNTSNPQDVYVRVQDNATGCTIATAVVTLSVATGATATAVAVSPLTTCDTDGVNDGVFNGFDLTQMNTEILGAQAPAGFTVAYYSDAAATQLITTATSYGSASGFVYAQVTNTSTGCVSNIISIPVRVEMLPEPVVTSDTGGNTICVDFETGVLLSGITLNSNLTSSNHTFQWYLGGVEITGAVSANYTVNTVTPGIYSVIATSTTGLLCASNAADFEVIQSGPPVLVDQGFTVSSAFASQQMITVNVQGFGNYEYSLDLGPWQSSNIFTGVGPGTHSVRVRDGNNTSCGDAVIPVVNIIDYPPYFTPNGDGIHDTWNIIGLDDTAKIYIFDRYGKLLKQISPTGEGWNGILNGEQLPSTDYWFSVQYPEAGTTREFKAHFSLKR